MISGIRQCLTCLNVITGSNNGWDPADLDGPECDGPHCIVDGLG